MKTVAVIDYGAGNTYSVMYALEKLGVNPVLTKKHDEIRQADRVIFPGVGNALSAMKAVKLNGLDQLIPELRQPVLGICLGMQLMGLSTAEGETEGLGIFDASVVKFKSSMFKIPHVGWNEIARSGSVLFSGVPDGAHVYFVHSYYMPLMDDTVAVTDYVLPFSAAIQKENFYGCQFHPEKSGEVGLRIMKNFIEL